MPEHRFVDLDYYFTLKCTVTETQFATSNEMCNIFVSLARDSILIAA